MLSTQESREYDEMAWQPQKIEFGIMVVITMVIAGDTFTGQADFTHMSVEDEGLDYRSMSIAWFEGNCTLHNISWDKANEHLNLYTLSELEALANEFNFDVDYQEVCQ